jgi:hypothetical protein
MSVTTFIGLTISSALIAISPELPSSYQMEARLDTASQKISGSEKILFLNPTDDSLKSLCFHLYPNAFKDTATVFARENGEIKQDILSGNTSELKVSSIALNNQILDSTAIKEDGTRLFIALPSKLAPREQIAISMNYELKVPRIKMRMGYDKAGNYLISHWHPILCGYQKGHLVDFEYHSNGEFFSNFSNYNVRLEIPSGYTLGASGEISLLEKDSIKAVYRILADTVIDFAFACGPKFDTFEQDTLGIKIRYLLRQDHLKYQNTTKEITGFSLGYNSEKLFQYPYSTFTVIDMNAGAEGIELPGMVVVAYPGFKNMSISTTLINISLAHEITHEWFYGAVATNEAYEPWLDEGITSYQTFRILEAGGDSLSQFKLFGYHFSYGLSEQLIAYMTRGEWPIDRKSWDYPDPSSYAAAVYDRASLVLQTLEEVVGRAKFDEFLKAYANDFRFKHPDKADFISNAARYTGDDMSEFTKQFIDGTARLDYSIRALEFQTIANADSSRKYEITVTASRELDGILPQKIHIGLENGAIDTTWDGRDRIVDFNFFTGARPEFAAVKDYALDENKANNTLYIKSFGSRLLSFEWDTIFSLEFLLSLVL